MSWVRQRSEFEFGRKRPRSAHTEDRQLYAQTLSPREISPLARVELLEKEGPASEARFLPGIFAPSFSSESLIGSSAFFGFSIVLRVNFFCTAYK